MIREDQADGHSRELVSPADQTVLTTRKHGYLQQSCEKTLPLPTIGFKVGRMLPNWIRESPHTSMNEHAHQEEGKSEIKARNTIEHAVLYVLVYTAHCTVASDVDFTKFFDRFYSKSIKRTKIDLIDNCSLKNRFLIYQFLLL